MHTRSQVKKQLRKFKVVKVENKNRKTKPGAKYKKISLRFRRSESLGKICRISKTKNSSCSCCKKPFKKEEGWKKYCNLCFLKQRGNVVSCKACDKEFLSFWDLGDNNYCYDCGAGINGGTKYKCEGCAKTFYKPKYCTVDKTHCYSCYLKTVGVKKRCLKCRKDIYVKKEDLKWKKRCESCYIHSPLIMG